MTEMPVTKLAPVDQRTRAARRSLNGLLVPRIVLPAIALVLAIWVPFTANSYWVYLIAIAFVYAVLSMGFNVILGWCGQLAFTSAAFFGVGAFVAGKVTVAYDVPVEMALLAGTGAGAVIGAAFGALVVRLQRYYLAIATFALLFVLSYVYVNFDELTGGVNGFAVPPAKLALGGGAELDADYQKYFIGLMLLVIVYVVLALVQRSRAGRGWRVVHQDERVATALGISPYRSKLAAFTVSASVMALAGSWFVFALGSFLPGSFSADELLFDFLIVVFGGLGSLNGAVLGSIALVIAREYLRDVPGASELLFGFVLLATALVMRHGIYGALARTWSVLRERVA